MSVSNFDAVRRGAAFVKSILEDDSLAHQVLGPETPGLIEQLWVIDPLRAALFTPALRADSDLVSSLCALVINIAKPAMDEDDLAALLGRLLALEPGSTDTW